MNGKLGWRGIAALAVLAAGLAGGAAGAATEDRTEVRVGGRFANQRGEPMAGVTITLLDANGNPAHDDTTDASGEFDLGAVEPGTYALSVTVIGWEFALDKDGRRPLIEVREDGSLEPDILTVLLKNRGRFSPGMWGQMLLFVGLAVGGGVAVF